MSSFKSYFGKSHVYNTQADLKDMTPEQIVNLNPKEVSSNIETNTGGIPPLTGIKQKALFRLLAIKRANKANPSELARQSAIDNFLTREGLKSGEVTSLIIETNKQVMREKLEEKDLQNRFRALKDQPTIPYTEEEALFRRINALGGKIRRNRRTMREKRIKKGKRTMSKKITKKGKRTKKTRK